MEGKICNDEWTKENWSKEYWSEIERNKKQTTKIMNMFDSGVWDKNKTTFEISSTLNIPQRKVIDIINSYFASL